MGLRRADARHVAHRFAGRLAGVFGENNTFLSIELHGEDDLPVARSIVAMGEFLGLDRVAVQPVYGLEPESMPRLRLLAAIQNAELVTAGKL